MNLKYIFILVLLVVLTYARDHHHGTRRISSCEELRALRNEKVLKRRIKLVNDIDCENRPFIPLKILFTKFDGDGHTIKNLNLRYDSKKKNIHQIGLFKSLASGSIVRNVTFINVNVRGIRNVGIVAGNSHMALVEHVRVDSELPHGNKVIGRSNKVGGLIGYAKDSTFNHVSVKRTIVRGFNKVGGIVGLFTGGQMVDAGNLGFSNSSLSIVEGIKSVGGIVGESSSSSYLKVGVKRGVIFGESSVGSIAGKAFDTERADQLYVQRNVRLIFRSGRGNEFGGLFGSYIIEGDSKYSITNSYTKARVIGKERAGGLIGYMNIDSGDSSVRFENLIVASPVKNAKDSGKLVGVLNYNPSLQTFKMLHVFYWNQINEYLQEVGLLKDSPGADTNDLTDPDYKKKKSLPTVPNAIGLEYVDIVQRAIEFFDQNRVWCQDRLREEQLFNARYKICRCGPHSQDYFGNCLCSSYTELSHNKSFCINSTGICTPPSRFRKNYVGLNDNIFLEIYAENVHFVENGKRKGNLEVHLRYTPQNTGWTDIVVLGKKGIFISSLSNYLLGKGYDKEKWTQSIDKTGADCVQQASFSLPWDKIATLAQVAPGSGDFLLRVYAHTNLFREEKKITLRDLRPQGENAELITAVPIFISLNTSVTTSASLSAKFNLDFNIDCTYYVKSSSIDTTGLKMTVVIAHTISNPLSLDVVVVGASVDDVPTNAVVLNSVGTPCLSTFNLDNTNSVCEQETTLVIDLPMRNGCQDKMLNLNITFDSSCEGPNKINSTVCPSVYEQVRKNNATSVPVSIDFSYNFCPKIEDTSLTTTSFTVTQENRNIVERGIIFSDHPLNGTILLKVQRSVVDSAFDSASIHSIFLYQKKPSKEGVQFIDITLDCLPEKGFQVRQDEIQISFSYIPNIYMLSKLLRNWYSGLYFVVTIDVHYQPAEYHKKSKMNAQIRLQIPNIDSEKHPISETARSQSSQFTIQEDLSKKRSEKTITKDDNFSFEKAKEISDQYKKEANRNHMFMVVILTCLAITFLVFVITSIIVIHNHFKSKKENNTLILQN